MSGQVLSLVDAARLEQLITEDIADAVAAERERCAQLVERMAAESPGPQGYGITVLMDTDKIAAAIRRSPAGKDAE